MQTEPATIRQPNHPLHALTSYELARYRRELEGAVAFFGRQDPVPPGAG